MGRYQELGKYDHRTGKLFLPGTVNGFWHLKVTCSSHCGQEQTYKNFFLHFEN